MTPLDVLDAQKSFQSPLIVEYEDGRNWIVRQEFVYVSPRITVRVPVNFETDFASIPRLVWRWMSPTDWRIGKPAVIHDFLYRTPAMRFTRQEADSELREAMKCVGANSFDRNAVYWAVRAGGGRAWKERRA